ncbi:hypothetical protein [Pseudomonas sp. KCJK9111]|uniref:hypothetical protein n=1 Tax=Pseudomonas sp. KCJK9111 TaxID=3344555 RepID=UPI003905A7BD
MSTSSKLNDEWVAGESVATVPKSPQKRGFGDGVACAFQRGVSLILADLSNGTWRISPRYSGTYSTDQGKVSE